MIKKMMLLAAAVAALVAFAAPAAAQANNPVITNVLGQPAEHITADGIEVVTVVSSSLNTIKCTTVGLTITLTQNTHGVASGHGTGFGEGNPTLAPSNPKYDADDCVSSSGLGVDITTVTVGSVTLNSGGSGAAAFGYTYDLKVGPTIIAECAFTGTAALEKTGGDKIKLVDGTLVGGSAPCPPSGTIVGEFTLTDEFGEAATID